MLLLVGHVLGVPLEERGRFQLTRTEGQAISCELVLAEYDQVQGAVEAAALVDGSGCAVFIYSKSSSCSTLFQRLPTARCMHLPNVGREQHTFAHHVSTRWDSLSDRVLFSALPLTSHKTGILQAQPDNRRA
eukprot:6167929-Prymnesium_polylepis.1